MSGFIRALQIQLGHMHLKDIIVIDTCDNAGDKCLQLILCILVLFQSRKGNHSWQQRSRIFEEIL